MPGSIYIGKCLSSYEPALWFCYVLLSRDLDNDVYYWTTAMFTKGYMGAQVKKFTGDEIDQLGYVGHVASVILDEVLDVT